MVLLYKSEDKLDELRLIKRILTLSLVVSYIRKSFGAQTEKQFMNEQTLRQTINFHLLTPIQFQPFYS